ncbi:hypothetical protein CC1G_01500 [Coprinopsis cinerea okayama7|uniref:Uncharacterized protein n=1 Tax=Coprinopsis cinerea (strain Okayama-7 / 130 / ATCC MYA-4618 / FGSC 9003) TaxID=240176 RepID=A8NHT5_COPC7|nr:hypothetical protein CC1G_01500 [Coprinopsis cinerea okayama7\|eukprot:XP_001833823.1 hypothetical protein CC1G_01500 [Coprinopsis cinerea okayama7\
MHQEHNIPWNLLAQNVKFVHEHPGYTPRTTGFFAVTDRPKQANELNHFVRVFVATIRTFSETERRKYPSSDEFQGEGTGQGAGTGGKLLYSDELKARYPEFLNEKNQRVEYWIERRHEWEVEVDVGEGKKKVKKKEIRREYATSHGDLADAVKVLIIENQMEALLMLANHPDVPLHQLYWLSWGHHFGWSRVMESALEGYLFFNLVAAKGLLVIGGEGGRGAGAIGIGIGTGIGGTKEKARAKYTEMDAYRHLVVNSTASMDFPAQQIPHRLFFGKSYSYCVKNEDLPEVHEEYERLKGYLKKNFELMYKCDMLMKECGREVEWEREVVHVLERLVRGLKVDHGWDEDSGKWRDPVFV